MKRTPLEVYARRRGVPEAKMGPYKAYDRSGDFQEWVLVAKNGNDGHWLHTDMQAFMIVAYDAGWQVDWLPGNEQYDLIHFLPPGKERSPDDIPFEEFLRDATLR